MGVSWGQPSGVCTAPTVSLVWLKTMRPYPVDARRCPISAIAQEGCLLRCCWCKVRHSFTERLGLSSPLCSSLLGETGDRTDLSPPGEGPSCSPGLWSPVWLYQKAAGRGGRDRAGIDKPVNFPWQQTTINGSAAARRVEVVYCQCQGSASAHCNSSEDVAAGSDEPLVNKKTVTTWIGFVP